MTLTLRLVLLVLAFVCFLAASVGVNAKVNLTAFGLALATLAVLVSR